MAQTPACDYQWAHGRAHRALANICNAQMQAFCQVQIHENHHQAARTLSSSPPKEYQQQTRPDEHSTTAPQGAREMSVLTATAASHALEQGFHAFQAFQKQGSAAPTRERRAQQRRATTQK